MANGLANIKKGIQHGFGFVLVVGTFLFGFYLVKGWNGLQATDGDTLTAAKWNELVGSANGAPSGAIVAFNLTTCPAGRKEANGIDSALDLRGVFLRGLDNGKGIDNGRELGTYQEDEFKSHNHEIGDANTAAQGEMYGYTRAPRIDYGLMPQESPKTMTFKGGSETRPKNVAVLYCIKE
ncbi:MAG: hypothetical protein V3575_02510 [Candidatus Absconditabacteria bacterium]